MRFTSPLAIMLSADQIPVNFPQPGSLQAKETPKSGVLPSIICKARLGRPLAGALAGPRAPPSPADITAELTGAARRLACSDDGHADRTPGTDRAIGLVAWVVGIHATTINANCSAHRRFTIALLRVDDHAPRTVIALPCGAATDGKVELVASNATAVPRKIGRKNVFTNFLRFT